jgi:MerR family transcriptional regulator/heat shock protein HspR
VTALRGRNRELRHRVTELQTALEATLSSLQDRRPNLPVLRPSNPISPFRDPR